MKSEEIKQSKSQGAMGSCYLFLQKEKGVNPRTKLLGIFICLDCHSGKIQAG